MDTVGIAFGALSPLGRGDGSLAWAPVGAPPRVAVADDARLAGLGLERRAAARALDPDDVDADPLATALDECVARLDVVLPGWRDRRVGLVLGTSSGSMRRAQLAYAALAAGRAPERDHARALAYGSPFLEARARLGLAPAREAHVLAACASSTVALGLAHDWLAGGGCDVVLAGGYDALSDFVATGFAALGAITASTPRPFQRERDGLALGEGAGVVALVRAEDAPQGAPTCLVIGGFSAATDAVHLTAPDRSGEGLARAIRGALARSGTDASEIGLVGAHATATPYNDPSEARAFAAALGARSGGIPTHAPKAAMGHLLGAAGVVETLSLARGLETGVAPPSAGEGTPDPDAPAALVRVGTAIEAEAALKTSLAFGGVDAALVLRRSPRRAIAGVRRSPSIADVIRIDGLPSLEALAARAATRPERLARLDVLSLIVVAAVAEVAARFGRERLAQAALVVGHDVATVATNAAFWARALARGPRLAEPRRFAYTTPNACVGEAALLFAIHGPTLAVGGAPGLSGQCLEIAGDLVAAGHADLAIAVEASESSAAGDALHAAFGGPPSTTSAVARVLVA
jgi:3-oxoacyl-[acyl-carrier-protein] synthase-1/3-oxoacyl-[acyl-carrier-protein] synthase II